ncbi:RDD family protein [Patescibacteria group bacterium]|nr:RDD family protein [Patescibacteria group bacterium]
MNNSNTNNIASPTMRLFAFLIDVSIRALIFLLIISGIFSASSTDKILTSLLSSAILIVAVNTIILPLVQVYLTSKFGGSIGKLVCEIKVVDKQGNLLNFKRAFFRNYLGYIVSATFLHFGFILILVDKEEHRA